ncbi:MAG: hypothetical protein DPW09_10045 [Anaerolineae bacterium]|nr:hypothetical protein [Anaerolineae bacterium]
MRFDFVPKYGPIGWLWAQLSKPAFRRICEMLLDNWEVKMKEQMGQATHPRAGQPQTDLALAQRNSYRG